jgi:hypothetical protein
MHIFILYEKEKEKGKPKVVDKLNEYPNLN